jgi:aminopeptidase-like protein
MMVRLDEAGGAMHRLAAELFPICRSMTGEGVRQTLRRLQELIPLTIHEAPTGEKAFDWEVPLEWNIREAWIADESGRRVIDFRDSNLHVVAGSAPVRTRMTWSELAPRLHTLPEHPHWVPYRVTHDPENWGFCLSRRQFEELAARGEHRYDVVIDSSLQRGSLTYGELVIPGRRGDAEIDRVMRHVLEHSRAPFTILDFEPFGYDQRQYCSPGINLPIGCMMRTPNECYPEYHTSADNLELIRPESLADSWSTCVAAMHMLEGNHHYRNLNPCCEPRLGPRGLYRAFGSGERRPELQQAVLWVLNLSDGDHDLLSIAERSKLPFDIIRIAADLLLKHELLEPIESTALRILSPLAPLRGEGSGVRGET